MLKQIDDNVSSKSVQKRHKAQGVEIEVPRCKEHPEAFVSLNCKNVLPEISLDRLEVKYE